MLAAKAREVMRVCRRLAECSEQPGITTRTFLSPPMREVHAQLGEWMRRAGMTVDVDAAGNLRGVYPAASDDRRGGPSRLRQGSGEARRSAEGAKAAGFPDISCSPSGPGQVLHYLP